MRSERHLEVLNSLCKECKFVLSDKIYDYEFISGFEDESSIICVSPNNLNVKISDKIAFFTDQSSISCAYKEILCPNCDQVIGKKFLTLTNFLSSLHGKLCIYYEKILIPSSFQPKIQAKEISLDSIILNITGLKNSMQGVINKNMNLEEDITNLNFLITTINHIENKRQKCETKIQINYSKFFELISNTAKTNNDFQNFYRINQLSSQL